MRVRAKKVKAKGMIWRRQYGVQILWAERRRVDPNNCRNEKSGPTCEGERRKEELARDSEGRRS